MLTQQKDPITIQRTTWETRTATAAEVVQRLSTFDVDELPARITPFLAAAGAEIAFVADIRWRFSPDDPNVALLRLISRGAIAKPDATGPHTQRLFDELLNGAQVNLE